MGLQPKKTTLSGGIPVWQGKVRNAQGGFVLAAAVIAALAADTVKAGTPVAFNEATRQVSVLKTGRLAAVATNVATTYNVEKGHHFKVGDYLAAVVGAKAYAITAIDTSNASYDVLTVGTTLGAALVAGDVLFQSSATGPTNAALNVTPNGLIYDDVDAEANASCSVVLAGVVYDRRTPGVPSAVKSLLPTIIFSQSF